jgi:hypothetical protein
MPTLDMIQKKYKFNIDDISDIIFIWANSKDKKDFVEQFVDKFEIEDDDVFSVRDLDTLYNELGESDEVKVIVDSCKNGKVRKESKRFVRPERKTIERKSIKEAFGNTSIKDGDSVIVSDKNELDLPLGQILTVDKVEGKYVIFTKGGKQYGILATAVKSLVEEKHIDKSAKMTNQTMTRQYIDLIKEGYSHLDSLRKIAEGYNCSVDEVEDKINDTLNVAGRRKFKKLNDVAECKELKEDNEFPEEEAYEEEYNEIADKVLVYLLRNSDDYRGLYDSIDDAVDATLTFLRLKEKIGKHGVEKVVEIIKDKYASIPNGEISNEDIGTEEQDQISESNVERSVVECVKKSVGCPSYWAMTKEHFIAGFANKNITNENLDSLKKFTNYDYISENNDYSLLYFKRK